MSIPQYQPQPQWAPPPQQWTPPAPATRPARIGKIGFWTLLAGMLTGTLATFGSYFFFANGGADNLDPNTSGGVIILVVILNGIGWVVLFGAATLGIVSLARRERPVWWAILATCAPAIGYVGTIIAVIAFAIIGSNTTGFDNV